MDPWVYTLGVDPKEELARHLGDARLPSFPSLQIRILDVLRDPDSHTGRLVELVAMDPGLTVQLLRGVNSAAFGAPGRVTSISQAVRIAGRAWIEHLVLALTVRDMVDRRVPTQAVREFWAAAAFRAAFAERLAAASRPEEASLCFTVALLQDMAMPLLAQHGGLPYGLVLAHWQDSDEPLHVIERQHLGWDHADVAFWLAASWGLPGELCQAIGGHHGPSRRCPTAPAAVRVAGLAFAGAEALRSAAEAELGLGPEALAMALSAAQARHGELVRLVTR
jgi:HD-like signal output (HDOD) protein